MDRRESDRINEGHKRAVIAVVVVTAAGALLQQLIVGPGKTPASIGIYEAIGFVVAGIIVLGRLWVIAAAWARAKFPKP